MDRLAIAAALREARGLPGLPGLALNIHAATLEQDRDLPFWSATWRRRTTSPPSG